MSPIFLAASLLLGLPADPAPDPAAGSAAAALEKLRGLAGRWSGTYELSGGRGGGTLDVETEVRKLKLLLESLE